MTVPIDLISELPAVTMNRRRFLRTLALGSAAFALGVPAISSAASDARHIAFFHTHTNEHLDVCYFANGKYRSSALKAINTIFRDHRTGAVHTIDPALIDLIWAVRGKKAATESVHIISGFRSRETNQTLRKKSTKVARKSFHMAGKAADIRIPGRSLASLRRQALALKCGGVGYYPDSNFVHLDTGRFRYW